MNNLKPRVIVAQLGARHHYAIPVVFYQGGYLTQFFTDAYVGDGSWLKYPVALIPENLKRGAFKRLAQRKATLPSNKVTAYNGLGFNYWKVQTDSKKNKKNITDVYLDYGQKFLKKIIYSSHLKEANIIYGFSGSALELFEFAKAKGLYCICDQMLAPTQVVDTILEAELTKWRGWEQQVAHKWGEIWYEREHAEWQLADVIIAPSEFVKESLVRTGAIAEKIKLIPYATPIDRFTGKARQYERKRPLRLLFAGGVGLRKGVPYLLEALKKLNSTQIECRVIGSITISSKILEMYEQYATFTGHISRAEMVAQYQWADVFVFPSLCEGSAVVTYEAKATGLPVIATFNSGAWIKEGIDGFIIPIRDVDALAEAIERFLMQPDLVGEMSQTAMGNASNFSWQSYEKRLSDLVMLANRGEI